MQNKVFTVIPGLKLALGVFGVASNATPCVVPDNVAQELEEEIKGERPNPNFSKFRDTRGADFYETRQAAVDANVPEDRIQEETERVLKLAQPRTDIRIERGEAPSAPAASSKKKAAQAAEKE